MERLSSLERKLGNSRRFFFVMATCGLLSVCLAGLAIFWRPLLCLVLAFVFFSVAWIIAASKKRIVLTQDERKEINLLRRWFYVFGVYEFPENEFEKRALQKCFDRQLEELVVKFDRLVERRKYAEAQRTRFLNEDTSLPEMPLSEIDLSELPRFRERCEEVRCEKERLLTEIQMRLEALCQDIKEAHEAAQEAQDRFLYAWDLAKDMDMLPSCGDPPSRFSDPEEFKTYVRNKRKLEVEAEALT